jgi:urea carboxylase-associated protein 2
MTDTATDALKVARVAALRARYEALRAQGQSFEDFECRIAAVPRLQHPVPPEQVVREEAVPPGWYWYRRLPAGSCLRLDNAHGTPGVACLLWNAADPVERFCAPDTVKVQWTTRLGRGRMLLSDMGRVLATLIEDTCGRHDVLLGAGPPRMPNSSPLSSRNGPENLLLAAAKLGLSPRDLHAPITFFAPVACGADQRFGWDTQATIAGTFVDLYAEMDLYVCLSNVPHPVAPAASAPRDLRLVLWRPEYMEVLGVYRSATPEARRAFARTKAYISGAKSNGGSR